MRSLSASPRNLDSGEIGLEFRRHGLGDLLGRAVALGPLAAAILFRILLGGGESRCHRVRVDGILDSLRELFFDRASLALDSDGGRNVFPIEDTIFRHADLCNPDSEWSDFTKD